jgi:hypothetical protein
MEQFSKKFLEGIKSSKQSFLKLTSAMSKTADLKGLPASYLKQHFNNYMKNHETLSKSGNFSSV